MPGIYRFCAAAGQITGRGNITGVTQRYDHRAVETKWQRHWEEAGIYHSDVDWSRPKHYALTMLPYPSGDLHIGHWYAMTPSDARARYMRMRGFNVLFPMGFDAFGLPAENAAIQANIHPWEWTYANIERMRGQLRSMGTMIDWRREAVSCTPEYYRWSEWFFSRLYQAGLAYRGEALVNWSPSMQTVLANEQVINGRDERTGQPVVQKMMEQWFYRITRYAEELLQYDGIDWPDPVVAMQTNWIGRSEGARVAFPLVVQGEADPTGPSKFSPPGPTPCSEPLLWCWPPNIRWWRISPPKGRAGRWPTTGRRPPPGRRWNAPTWARKKPGWTPADSPSTRSTGSAFRCGWPTTC